ncbi:MAG TPA: hypothetical protein VF701_06215 [Thermoanaerobaculia bacterium]
MTLEQGTVTFLYRPRVEETAPDDMHDVQRVFALLAPVGSAFERLIAIGRERFSLAVHRRFWGFVDLVLAPYDMTAALGAHMYGTKTRGLRHLPAAVRVAEGIYEISAYGSHTHLQWWIDRRLDEATAIEIDLESTGDYIVTVANPDPSAWGLIECPDLQSQLFDELESHVTVPTPLPPQLQHRFHGRRFVPLTTDWLDQPGAEIIFTPVPSTRSW